MSMADNKICPRCGAPLEPATVKGHSPMTYWRCAGRVAHTFAMDNTDKAEVSDSEG